MSRVSSAVAKYILVGRPEAPAMLLADFAGDDSALVRSRVAEHP